MSPSPGAPMPRPRLRISTVNLSAPAPEALARFYIDLLGYRVTQAEPGYLLLSAPDGAVGLAVQLEDPYRVPVWPADGDEQQMMLHLEVQVDDLAVATDHALACGARLADYQPQGDVRVCLDPAGHPFCLWVER